MRRVRNLGTCNYIVPLGRSSKQILPLSSYNIILERTWHRASEDDFELVMHAKFNANSMNGIQLMAVLKDGYRETASAAVSFSLYRVAEASWVETLVHTLMPVTNANTHTGYISQATLGLNELSAKECYAFECVVTRKRRTFKRKIYFNHLGAYDHLILLRKAIEGLESLKVDD